MKAKPRKHQARDERTDNTDDNIADDAKAGAANDLSGEPACNQTDEQNNDKAFDSTIALQFPLLLRAVSRAAREPIHNSLT